MNVIGSRPDGWWRDRRGAMRRLVESLERFAAAHPDDEVAVVLDGARFDLHSDSGCGDGASCAPPEVNSRCASVPGIARKVRSYPS
jgi:hypothetical protein